MLARLSGGKADGWTCWVDRSPVYITMVDRVPRTSPDQVGPAADALLARAAKKWECYVRAPGTEPDPDGRVTYHCTRALPIYPPDDPPLPAPPGNTPAEVEDFLDRLPVDGDERAELRELLRKAGYGRPT